MARVGLHAPHARPRVRRAQPRAGLAHLARGARRPAAAAGLGLRRSSAGGADGADLAGGDLLYGHRDAVSGKSVLAGRAPAKSV